MRLVFHLVILQNNTRRLPSRPAQCSLGWAFLWERLRTNWHTGSVISLVGRTVEHKNAQILCKIFCDSKRSWLIARDLSFVAMHLSRDRCLAAVPFVNITCKNEMNRIVWNCPWFYMHLCPQAGEETAIYKEPWKSARLGTFDLPCRLCKVIAYRRQRLQVAAHIWRKI